MLQCVAAFVLALVPQSTEFDKQLILAIGKGDLKQIEQQLQRGASPNAREEKNPLPSLGNNATGGVKVLGDSALNLTIRKGNLPMVKLLLSKGADLNLREEAGYTPLIFAVQTGQMNIAEYLIDKGAKVDIRNDHGDTAIVFAANAGDVRIVDRLLRKKANINGGTGWSPLMEAAYSGRLEVAKLLLKRGADPNYHPRGLMTPLECANVQRHTALIEVISKAGGKGRTAAEIQRAASSYREALDKERKQRAAKFAESQKLTPDDFEVIEASLVAVLEDPDRGLYFDPKARRSISLITESAGDFSSAHDTRISSSVGPERAKEISLEIRVHLNQRNSLPISLSRYQARDSRIGLTEVTPDRVNMIADMKANRAWVRPWLPGYSKDRTKAVFTFWCGPSPHGASGTCFLEKSGGKWRVKWLDMAFYV
ncbi:MAG: ankyrin repeat domain-containing protein [Chlorobia bacterium]|nr:ankyrin repeat domain-containing protein [Fimbriimonadaceae bacterium]